MEVHEDVPLGGSRGTLDEGPPEALFEVPREGMASEGSADLVFVTFCDVLLEEVLGALCEGETRVVSWSTV